jgi:hypothetical protein
MWCDFITHLLGGLPDEIREASVIVPDYIDGIALPLKCANYRKISPSATDNSDIPEDDEP